MREYDLTITAALRPDLVKKCCAAICKYVRPMPRRVYVNIDPAGPGKRGDVAEVIHYHFPDALIRVPSEPSFPLAVRWLWQRVESPALLHVEDSKEIDRPVNLHRMLDAMDELAAVSLKFVRPEWEVVGPPRVRRRADGLFQTDYYDKAVCMQPTLWRTEVATTLAGWMQHGISPEKTIRPGPYMPDRENVIAYMRQHQFGFVTDTPREFWYKRHGSAWRARTGYRKKGKPGIPDTWAKTS